MIFLSHPFYRFIFIFIVFSLGLNACHFHLRGQSGSIQNLKGKKILLRALDDSIDFLSVTTHTLPLFKLKRVDDPEKADYQIMLLKSSIKRISSGFDDNGRTNEYELMMQVDVVFMVPKLTDILHQQHASNPSQQASKNHYLERKESLKLSRNYSFNTSNLIGKKTEEEMLLKSMKKNLALQLIQRLSHFHQTAR
jgi:outer membrane lipopolysaccharide assembly protein LptE/RlpB